MFLIPVIPGVKLHNFTKYKAKTEQENLKLRNLTPTSPLNPELSKEENDEEEKIMETEEMESESKTVKSNILALKKKEKEEKDRLFIEENLKWIEQNLAQRFEM